jgi:hypothetical protein
VELDALFVDVGLRTGNAFLAGLGLEGYVLETKGLPGGVQSQLKTDLLWAILASFAVGSHTGP